ncbi:uncharacterized protein LOC119568473 [Penaeus monodon]|uniref:uncharacterized protein LOC119568473 n=1 Tax=Penaeus monodon TaxID=6687 RepID=UPI0018A6D928|nr:uncharacterized protein LOC119568473 [Penaeus monodon]
MTRVSLVVIQQGHSELTCKPQSQLPQGHRHRFSNNRNLRPNGDDGCLDPQRPKRRSGRRRRRRTTGRPRRYHPHRVLQWLQAPPLCRRGRSEGGGGGAARRGR